MIVTIIVTLVIVIITVVVICCNTENNNIHNHHSNGNHNIPNNRNCNIKRFDDDGVIPRKHIDPGLCQAPNTSSLHDQTVPRRGTRHQHYWGLHEVQGLGF